MESPFPLKRFVLVRYDSYYPSGGLGNIRGSYDTIEAAKAALADDKWHYDFTEIHDATNGNIVYES